MKRALLAFMLLFLIALPVMGQDATTMVYAAGANPTTLSPLYQQSTNDNVPIWLLFASLYDYDPMTGLPVPGLASWEISEDGLTYTFTIRDDAVWSDGTPITSTDAKFYYDALASNEVASSGAGQVQDVAAVNIVDDKTFEVVLKKVNCAFLNDFNPHFIPASRYAPDFTDAKDNPYNSAPDIASGPYTLVEWKQDEYLRFKANPNYWKGKPQIENFVIRVISDPSVLVQSLQTGESDYAWMFADQISQFTDRSRINFVKIPSHTILYLALNLADPANPQPGYNENGDPVEQAPHPIFGDLRVRQAIAMGFDRQAILEAQGEGGGTLVGALYSPANWAYDAEVQPWPYDPEASAKLLDEAGWALNEATGIREKDGKPLAFEIAYTPDWGKIMESSALIEQDQLSQLGMDISVTAMESGAFIAERLTSQTSDATVFTGYGGVDPSGNYKFFFDGRADTVGGCCNVSSYVNPELDKLADEALAMPGCAVEDRLPYYKQIQKTLHDDVPWNFILAPNSAHVVNKRVANYNLTAGNTLFDNFFPDLEQWTLSQ